jgi:hypothetical protein
VCFHRDDHRHSATKTHGLDTPVEILLQKRNNFSRLETTDLVLSKTITKSTSQRNRPSNELMLLCLITTVCATSDLYRKASELYLFRREKPNSPILLANTTWVPTRLGSSPHLAGSGLKSPYKYFLAYRRKPEKKNVQGRCTRRR